MGLPSTSDGLMTLPTATYRIQFRNGMTFDRACGLVPYLKTLGISHLYASPIFSAVSGSTHAMTSPTPMKSTPQSAVGQGSTG